MTTEAQRLADRLQKHGHAEEAALLRRQEAALRQAREALTIAETYISECLYRHDEAYQRHPATESERKMIEDDIEQARAAIAKAQEQA